MIVGDKIKVFAWGGTSAEIVDETSKLWAILSADTGMFGNPSYKIDWIPEDKQGEWYSPDYES